MAGIKHLKDLFDSKGISFIQNLFSNSVYITEKIDGSRFSFKKEDGELVFFKRNAKTPINMIDRTIVSFYEPAISHIESLKLSSIPNGMHFGFEYFANSTPGSIVYDKLPKNGLILTDVANGGTSNTNIDDLIKYSKTLKTDPPPVIFNGKLSAKQKEQLVDFLTTDWDELFTKFKTESFTSYIISILNPKLKNTALNIGTSKAIEGIVFSFNDGDAFINAKVVDPLYTEKARDMARNRQNPAKNDFRDSVKVVMTDLIKFSKSKASYDTKLTTKTKDARYVELLSDIFYQYYLKNKSKFSKIVLNNSGEQIKEFDVNYKFVSNAGLVKTLKSNNKVKTVFKMFLLSFSRERKKTTYMLDTALISTINSLRPKLHKLSEGTKTVADYSDNILNEILKKTML